MQRRHHGQDTGVGKSCGEILGTRQKGPPATSARAARLADSGSRTTSKALHRVLIARQDTDAYKACGEIVRREIRPISP
jgi:hypothetical protein